MHFIDWLIVIIPTLTILWLSFHSRKYVHGVVDFLAAGRVAGRYVISVGDMTNAMSIMTLVGLVEMKYQTGYALAFWQFMIIPVSIFMGLTGYCIYRFRETKALSMGQFLEMRYSRRFRVLASTLRTISEMLTNAIGPAIAATLEEVIKALQKASKSASSLGFFGWAMDHFYHDSHARGTLSRLFCTRWPAWSCWYRRLTSLKL